jgi:hypothetical protein
VLNLTQHLTLLGITVPLDIPLSLSLNLGGIKVNLLN